MKSLLLTSPCTENENVDNEPNIVYETITFDKKNTPYNAPQMKYLEGKNAPIYPESLFEAQHIKRLGELPQWLIELKSVNK